MTGSAPREPIARLYTFEQMNLQVGTRLQFITHRTLKPVQHFSTVVGWVKDEYLIVRIPVEQGTPIGLYEGDKLTLRVFSGVNVCTFSTVAERIFGRPLFYVHLTFPDEIFGTSLRTAMRVKVDLPAQLKMANGDEHAGLLANLSVSGALLESAQPLPPVKEAVDVQFTLVTEPDKRQVTVMARASIRNVSAVEPTAGTPGKYGYGLQFIDLDPSYYLMLQNLTYQALIGDRQKIV
ncbi:c-di-GMP-binding flagellar brake protein YcgR [Pseudoduganella lurida]|uniref:C-di-GMP-binding flagellar brake protein YcgR n=1 Tax=Pseudoduganella lurida TaxID=1036180 RepID=A0A562RCF5_9BURK|nr:flagellar brake protein [Pseudoduganella lurida]TWI66120.1 c-di-GMP-binding flagellar brake protein YcgR [Pseudoduganella lurida]